MQYATRVWPPGCGVLRYAGHRWLKFDRFPDLSQQQPTRRNKVAKRAQHVALNNVALKCCNRLAGGSSLTNAGEMCNRGKARENYINIT